MTAELIRNTVLTLTITTALVACSDDDDMENIVPDTTDNNTSMPAPGSDPGEVITLEGLDGDWEKACLANADDATFSTTALSAADNTITITESVFTDSACSTAAVPAEIETERSLSFDGTTTATGLGDASNVAWTIETRTIDGVSDTSDINSVVNDLMLITNDTLYFGDRAGANDGTTEALRPTTLDEVNIFTSSE